MGQRERSPNREIYSFLIISFSSDVADFINVHKLTATKQEAHSSLPDVKETTKASTPRPMPVAKGFQYDDIEATSMRKTIAKRLTLCKVD